MDRCATGFKTFRTRTPCDKGAIMKQPTEAKILQREQIGVAISTV